MGAGEYLSHFLDAGYDLPFIAAQGLQDADLECIGIPKTKMGLRRKLMSLYDLGKYYTKEEEEEEEESGEESDDEDEDESEEDEED